MPTLLKNIDQSFI